MIGIIFRLCLDLCSDFSEYVQTLTENRFRLCLDLCSDFREYVQTLIGNIFRLCLGLCSGFRLYLDFVWVYVQVFATNFNID